ncbi:MAG: hypothetical protein ACOX9R_14275 [Armatimonadota bacterium]
MNLHHGDATTYEIDARCATETRMVEQPLRPVSLDRIAMPAEGAMTPSNLDLDAAKPFGAAVTRLPDGRLRVNATRIRRIYELTSSAEKKDRDRGTCGRLRSGFVPRQSDYEDGRYE